jgi:hypothetical protein
MSAIHTSVISAPYILAGIFIWVLLKKKELFLSTGIQQWGVLASFS